MSRGKRSMTASSGENSRRLWSLRGRFSSVTISGKRARKRRARATTWSMWPVNCDHGDRGPGSYKYIYDVQFRQTILLEAQSRVDITPGDTGKEYIKPNFVGIPSRVCHVKSNEGFFERQLQRFTKIYTLHSMSTNLRPGLGQKWKNHLDPQSVLALVYEES